MFFTSGIRAGSNERLKRFSLKDKNSYGPWRITSALDAEDCLDIVLRNEVEPDCVASERIDGVLVNLEEVVQYRADLKDFEKRSKKAAAIITQTIDDNEPR